MTNEIQQQKASEWNLECRYCGGNHIKINPTGISFRPHTMNDFSDLPEQQQKYFSSLPNVVEAVFHCKPFGQHGEVVVECLDGCASSIGYYNQGDNTEAIPNKTKLKKALCQFYGLDEGMEL